MFKDQALENVPEGFLPVLGLYSSIKTTAAFGISNFFFIFCKKSSEAKGGRQLRKSM